MESFNGRLRDEFLNIEQLCLAARGKAAGTAAPNRVQRLQAAFGSPGPYASGSSPAMESGLITPHAFIRTRAAKGGTAYHTHEHVLAELNACADLMSVAIYCIVLETFY